MQGTEYYVKARGPLRRMPHPRLLDRLLSALHLTRTEAFDRFKSSTSSLGGDMDGRDNDTMDGILNDLQTAAHGLPVTFQVTPFDKPVVMVYVNDESTGSILVADRDPLTPDSGLVWWQVSTLTCVISHHETPRAALAAHLNEYIDHTVGRA